MVVPSGLTRGSLCSRLESTESIKEPRVSTRDPRAHKIVSFPLNFEEPGKSQYGQEKLPATQTKISEPRREGPEQLPALKESRNGSR